MLPTLRAIVLGGAVWGISLAADAAARPNGTYKLTFFSNGPQTPWLIRLETKDGKPAASVVSTEDGVPRTAVENLRLDGDRLRFDLKLPSQTFTFEGKVPTAAAATILGSFALGNQVVPAQLEPTKLQKLDSFERNKELVDGDSPGTQIFTAVIDLIREAPRRQVPVEEVRRWASKAAKAAEAHGPRWHREMVTRLANVLATRETYVDLGLEYARQAVTLIDPTDEPTAQTRPLEVAIRLLRKAGKNEEAQGLEARLAKLEERADQEYLKKMPPFEPVKYAGRKGKSDRAVLVELFTGAQCPPCVAADLAFDAVRKTYLTRDVVLLQYHLHVPGPDPLTNPASEARSRYYEDEVEGTPTILFNGKPKAGGGGPIAAAKEKYDEYREVIEPLLEEPARVRLQADVFRKGSKINISVTVSDLQKPGERMRLRLALVEEAVRYTGSNNLRFHHCVVRAMPGGPEGKALVDKNATIKAAIDLDELRQELIAYLDREAMREPFPNDRRPMEFQKLHVVAFVQDDSTKEVLQAIQVPVE
ncbi:MAG: hypothetical protein RMJ52_14845 [Gemmataceae bacterium]|nr:hypothetical protein [Gemmataceae bacterium]